jgi:ribosomal protein L12E/L44/L45/RPP1/RPP2
MRAGRPFFFTFYLANAVAIHPTDTSKVDEMLQKHVMSRLRVAMDGSDVKVLQDLLALGHGVNLAAAVLKEAKAKFRAVMQRAEESNKARGAAGAGGADKAKTEASNGPPSRRAASPAKPRLAKTGAVAGAVAGTAALDELRHLKALEVAELSARSKAGTGTGKGAAPSSAVTSAAAAEQPAASHRQALGGAPTAMRVASAALPRSTSTNTNTAVPNAIAAYAPPVTLADAAKGNNGTASEPLRPTTTPMAALFGSSDALMEAGLLLNDGLGSVRKAFEQAIVGMRAEKEKLHLELQLEQERSRQLAAQLAATMLLHGQKEAAELELAAQ